MGKHKAKLWERPAAYIPWAVHEAHVKFLIAWNKAQMTGDYTEVIGLRMRGRQGSMVRQVSDSLRVRRPKKWW